jgi:hypothetical protein
MSQRQPKSYMRKNKIAGQFSARTIAMMESPAFQVLSLSGRRVLDRLEIEHAHHGGNDNGELPCTYDDFADYGMDRHAIKAAINEVAALGFVEITEPGRAGNAEWRRPNKFRLTYRQVGRANPTDEWSRIKTMEQAATVAKMARGKNISQWGKTPILGGETPTTERPIHSAKPPLQGMVGKPPLHLYLGTSGAEYAGQGSRHYSLSTDPRAYDQFATMEYRGRLYEVGV